MHKKMKTGFSKISQELFENIKNKGINLSKKDMFYALHNKE